MTIIYIIVFGVYLFCSWKLCVFFGGWRRKLDLKTSAHNSEKHDGLLLKEKLTR